MQKTSFFSSIQDIQGLFDSVETGLVIFDSSKKLVFYNSFADRIFEISSHELSTSYCYNIFSKTGTTCSDCPLLDHKSDSQMTKSYTVVRSDGQTHLAKVILKRFNDYTVCTIKDVTKEVSLIKKIDLQKKEAIAKNILMERRYEKISAEFETSKQLIDNLPESLITIDNNLEIQQTNKSADELFSTKGATKCYEMLGYRESCELCPAEKGFNFAHGFKKRHNVGENHYTELFLRGADGTSGLLLFTDTTRQITLINQIKTQQSILTGIVELTKYMQKETDVLLVLIQFMKMALPALSATSALLFVDDVRPGSLWITLPIEITEPFLGDTTRSYLSREIQTSPTGVVDEHLFPWQKVTVLPLIGGLGKKVGMLAFNAHIGQEDEEKLLLYTDTLGAYLHNKLLMKQLEDHANKDPMTGLYNRRYFEKAFGQETENYLKCEINFSVVALDINKLKEANDVYGHETGDALIKKVAELLREAARKSDIVARLGGDEFVLLLTNSDQKSAESFCERLKNVIFDNVFIDIDGNNAGFPVSASVGSAGSDLYEISDLLSQADARMYADKELFYTQHKAYR